MQWPPDLPGYGFIRFDNYFQVQQHHSCAKRKFSQTTWKVTFRKSCTKHLWQDLWPHDAEESLDSLVEKIKTAEPQNKRPDKLFKSIKKANGAPTVTKCCAETSEQQIPLHFSHEWLCCPTGLRGVFQNSWISKEEYRERIRRFPKEQGSSNLRRYPISL